MDNGQLTMAVIHTYSYELGFESFHPESLISATYILNPAAVLSVGQVL
jgi:hypothetical protein